MINVGVKIFPMKEMARDLRVADYCRQQLLIFREKFITSFGMVEVAHLFLYPVRNNAPLEFLTGLLIIRIGP
jgi:hypothetical protein